MSRLWLNFPRGRNPPTLQDASSITKKGKRSSDSANIRAVRSRRFSASSSYYSWMMNGDFPLYTKKIITEIRCREKNEKQ